MTLIETAGPPDGMHAAAVLAFLRAPYTRYVRTE